MPLRASLGSRFRLDSTHKQGRSLAE
eukprot:COSAG01_NODE_62704_length_283_cov_0.847826_1_plen_25_part_10